jgi:hypothetical protein
MKVTERIQALITEGKSTERIKETAVEEGNADVTCLHSSET